MLIPAEEGLAKAREAILRAVELEPDLAEAHAVLGHLRFRHEWDWKGAEISLRKALELSPSNAEALRVSGLLARIRGRFDVAVELQRRALELDPLSTIGMASLGATYRDAGRLEEAEAWFRKALELAPRRRSVRSHLALVLEERGRIDEAWDVAQSEEERHVGKMVRAVIRHKMGHAEESDAILRELVEKDADVAAYQIAQIYAARNEADQAFAWLDRAYRQEDPGLADTGTDRLFQSLRADPRW
ncbi:MAG TPA: tetratricopeptide repeat protein, partial [Candidatus Eisenbacteria bacterium]|nr:tetratricopeptide repeat protein [Candidatus Eisenbacteria bacterium]